MNRIYSAIPSIVLFLVLFSGCIQSGDVIEEKDHPAFERGKSLLKVGKNKEALDEFLAVTRRLTECPHSHLECGVFCFLWIPVKILLRRFIISGVICYLSPIP